MAQIQLLKQNQHCRAAVNPRKIVDLAYTSPSLGAKT